MAGLAWSCTKVSRESMVLSMQIVLLWQASTIPPRQEGPPLPVGAGGSFVVLSNESFTLLATPVCSMIVLAYISCAAPKQLSTRESSLALHRTSTSDSRSMSKPWTISFVKNSLYLPVSFSSLNSACLASSPTLPKTSWRALILSSRDLLIAVDRAIAPWVSICFNFRPYSCLILSLVALTILNFSMANSSKALVVISSALSFASFKMNWRIWKICRLASF
mmetsp:Transcript_73123/g.136685  ORF Transcript_73123/g.136685 Transcript_73123/m.136685 type:complete len:221 (-) Transcript_73123:116-778(-)